ncbi:MAG: hypothetical protein CMK28_01925 [Porticoccaceae bacterium]|nr:hypothetical protein [Porticoccaceae bacterium]
MAEDLKKTDLPAGFLLGETLQLFSREKCTQKAKIYKFQNPSELYRCLTHLYSIYAMYISAAELKPTAILREILTTLLKQRIACLGV